MTDNRTIQQKKEDFLTVFKQSMAIKTLACRKIKIGRTMLYEYLNSDPEFALKVEEIEEAAKDFAEYQLNNLVALGDRAAVCFYLKAKAKDRGYY